MHPVIKIVSLIIVTVFITQGGWCSLLLAYCLVLPFYLINSSLWRTALIMIRRLKWFFLSILMVFYFFTPELPPAQQSISYVNQGLLLGLFRICALMVIIFAVNLFIKTTEKEEILAALIWILAPLRILYINIDRFSLRAVLTLEYIEYLSDYLTDYKKKNLDYTDTQQYSLWSMDYLKQKKASFFQLIEHSAIILHKIIRDSEQTSGKSYTINYLATPRPAQFLLPLALLFSFYLCL